MQGREQVDKQEFLENLIFVNQYYIDKAIGNTFEKVFVTDFEFIDRDYLKKHNSLKRINQKFNSLYRQYQAIIDRETLFNFCEEIITEYVLGLDRDYIIIAKDKNKKGKYNDDISTMLVMMETRVIRKIDDWRGTYTEKKGDTTIIHTAPFFESLDKPLGRESDGNGWYSDNPTTFLDVATEKNSMLYHENEDCDEVDSKLDKIYTDANLTDRQIEIIETLERTENNIKGEIYNKATASEILNIKEASVRKAFFDIKKKVKKAYSEKPELKLSRAEKIKKYEDFLDGVEDEKDVISFILDELNTDDMEYMLYEVKSDLRQYFITNFISRYNKDMINNKKTRKFCRYFLAEVYHYIDLLKYNDFMSKSVTVGVSILMKDTKGKDGANYFF